MRRKVDPQGFVTVFDENTGMSVRGEFADGSDPIYADIPELVDCKITNYCERGCTYCYMESSRYGKHCDMGDYVDLLAQLTELGVFQIALGGGEPTSHPYFVNILRLTRKAGIVPNYSTNGMRLTTRILDASREFCGAVAVSWHDWIPAEDAMGKLVDAGVKTNVHFILSEQNVHDAYSLLHFLDEPGLKPNAIIFLRFKPVGRGVGGSGEFSDGSLDLFWEEVQKPHPYKIGFDACMIPLVAKHTTFDPIFFDLCDGGRFSCFIDAVEMQMKKCSFDTEDGYDLRKQSVKQVWDEMTANVAVRNCELGLFA